MSLVAPGGKEHISFPIVTAMGLKLIGLDEITCSTLRQSHSQKEAVLWPDMPALKPGLESTLFKAYGPRREMGGLEKENQTASTQRGTKMLGRRKQQTIITWDFSKLKFINISEVPSMFIPY